MQKLQVLSTLKGKGSFNLPRSDPHIPYYFSLKGFFLGKKVLSKAFQEKSFIKNFLGKSFYQKGNL